ncbi:MAG: hypothetical protein ACRDGQ_01850, partial [Candidatus Limnocylindrales bacterium]
MQRHARTPLVAYAVVVLANYGAQVPYALHLYGLRFNPAGALLLGATFAWFAVGFGLLWLQRQPGYWILLGY